MKFRVFPIFVSMLVIAATASAAPSISGNYLELRTCDVMVGQCFANGEIGLNGEEAVLLWSVDQGAWNGVALDGLSVMAIVRAEDTLGDLKYNAPKAPQSLVITDARATAGQREALINLATKLGGDLMRNVVATKSSDMAVTVDEAKGRIATVEAGDLVRVSARPFFEEDGCCGHETPYYPPLTSIQQASPAVAEQAVITDDTLGCTWKSVESPNLFLGRFEA